MRGICIYIAFDFRSFHLEPQRNPSKASSTCPPKAITCPPPLAPPHLYISEPPPQGFSYIFDFWILLSASFFLSCIIGLALTLFSLILLPIFPLDNTYSHTRFLYSGCVIVTYTTAFARYYFSRSTLSPSFISIFFLAPYLTVLFVSLLGSFTPARP